LRRSWGRLPTCHPDSRQVQGRLATCPTKLRHYPQGVDLSDRFKHSSKNANNACVGLSSGSPRSELMVPCVLPSAGNAVADAAASFNALTSRCDCPLVSGCSATWRIKKGGMCFPLATCVTGDKSFWLSGSPNFFL